MGQLLSEVGSMSSPAVVIFTPPFSKMTLPFGEKGPVSSCVGSAVGSAVGMAVGSAVGSGEAVAAAVGSGEGSAVSAGVGCPPQEARVSTKSAASARAISFLGLFILFIPAF